MNYWVHLSFQLIGNFLLGLSQNLFMLARILEETNIFLLQIWFLNFKSCVLYNVFVDFDKLSILRLYVWSSLLVKCFPFLMQRAVQTLFQVVKCMVNETILKHVESFLELFKLDSFIFVRKVKLGMYITDEVSYKIMMLFQIICHSYLSGVPNVVPT